MPAKKKPTAKKTAAKKATKKKSQKSGKAKPAADKGQIDLLATAGGMPEDLVVPAAVIAQCFEITQARVRQLADLEIAVKISRDRYSLAASVQGYCRYLKRMQLDAEQKRLEETRLTRVRADSQELDMQIKMRDLYPKREVDEALFGVATTMTAMFDGSASRIASKLGGGAVLRKKLIDEFNEIRKQFAAGLREFSGRLTVDGWDSRATARPRTRRVVKKKSSTKRKR